MIGSAYEVGLQAHNPVTFIAAYLQFSINGVRADDRATSSAAIPSPRTRFRGSRERDGASGFSAIFDSPLPTLGTDISPWAYLGDTGVNYAGVNGYEEA